MLASMGMAPEADRELVGVQGLGRSAVAPDAAAASASCRRATAVQYGSARCSHRSAATAQASGSGWPSRERAAAAWPGGRRCRPIRPRHRGRLRPGGLRRPRRGAGPSWPRRRLAHAGLDIESHLDLGDDVEHDEPGLPQGDAAGAVAQRSLHDGHRHPTHRGRGAHPPPLRRGRTGGTDRPAATRPQRATSPLGPGPPGVRRASRRCGPAGSSPPAASRRLRSVRAPPRPPAIGPAGGAPPTSASASM